MEPVVTLGYWSCRGRAEKIRQLLAYCAVPYKEQIYNSATDGDKWFSQDKPKLLQLNPAANMPYLIDGDKVISQSDAICIYICHRSKRVDLLGRNADEWVMTATVHGIYKDLMTFFGNLMYATYQNPEAFQLATKNANGNFQTYLRKLNSILGDSQFMVGKITWVDFLVADIIQTLGLFYEEYLKPFPRLVEYQKRVWGLPELKNYFASGRFKERPCNGPYAAWQ